MIRSMCMTLLMTTVCFSAYEDFTAPNYTERDSNNDITISTTSIAVNTMQAQQDSAVYKDFGVDYFTGDFSHKMKLNINTLQGTAAGIFWSLSDVNGPTYEDLKNENLGIAAYVINSTPLIRVRNFIDDTYDEASVSASTDYYVKVARSSGVVSVYIYSDSGYSTLVDTISPSTNNNNEFRYYSSVGSQGTVSGTAYAYYTISNVDLDVGTDPTTNPSNKKGNKTANKSGGKQ